MELRVLKYFLAVAREGNISRAANFLYVTQPTLSRQLMDLEDELGKKLLIRGSHNVTLTDEGILLRKRAEEILDMVEKTEGEFRSLKDSVSGDIYIGGGESDVMKYIARIIKKMRVDYPNIRYHLHSGNADDVTERLDKGLLDFCILIQPADLLKYDYINIPDKDIWGVVMRKDTPLASKKMVKAEDLLGLPLICSRQVLRKRLVKNEFTEWFGKSFNKLNIVATYNLVYNAAVMVAEGVGYAVTLDKLLNITGESNLCFKPLKPKLESGLNIVWKKGQVFSKPSDIFLKRMQDEFASKGSK